MKHLKNIIFFFVIAGGVFFLVTQVGPVRDRVMPLLHLPSAPDVKGISTVRNPIVSAVTSQVTSQIQNGIGTGIQSVQEQLLHVHVSDILSGLQKAGVNVQAVEKLIQPKSSESGSKK
jgi:hypothetical protein